MTSSFRSPDPEIIVAVKNGDRARLNAILSQDDYPMTNDTAVWEQMDMSGECRKW
jgi:hypothetical protein